MIKLRDYQEEAVRAVFQQLEKPNVRKTAVVLPTGSGKTTVFGNLIKHYLVNNPEKRVVVASHLGLLTDQTGDRFRDEWGIESGVLQGQNYPKATDRCIITTMQSFREADKISNWARFTQKRFIPSVEALNVGLFIVDEAHYGHDSYQKIYEMFPNAKVVGFTATPFRSNKLMTNQFDSVAYTKSCQWMIDNEYLVPPILNETPFDTLEIDNLMATVISIMNVKHKDDKAVIYLKTIEDCNTARNILEYAGITASAVTSKLTGEVRDNLLSDFRKGKGPQVLVTVDVLTAGFDAPNLKAIFIPYKVSSVITYLQRVGRGLRLFKNKTHCDIYVGSNSPNIEKGFWEKVHKGMLHAGKRKEDYDDLFDLLEFGEDTLTQEERMWTKDVVDLAKKAKEQSMENIFHMIKQRSVPESLLNTFVNGDMVLPYNNKRAKTYPATPKQVEYLKKENLYREGITKKEASVLIEANARSKGWKPPQDEIVPSGKHKGKHFSKVPPMYWKFIYKNKYNNLELVESYEAYKTKIKRGK